MVFIYQCGGGVMMENIDLFEWVNRSNSSADKAFRQAVHVLILAVSQSNSLKTRMIFHGGLLLAIRFHGIRHTKDVDFVTADHRNQIDVEEFIGSLSEEIAVASETLTYGLDCKIQSHRMKPPGENRNFQTIKITMGYAYKGAPDHWRLIKRECPTVLEIDYSFNEVNQHIDTIQLVDGGRLQVYSLPDIVAEKFRAIIQQKTRNRQRRQDAFDIYGLLKNGYLEDQSLKILIYQSLLMKAESRNLQINQQSLADEEIITRSKGEYQTLAYEIDGDLPPFEEVYFAVRNYYEGLPWYEK
jgi:predicted nucleotidyltransferase component of viral defense system